MIFEEFGVIELEKYLEELKRDYPIYGDVLKWLTMDVKYLPYGTLMEVSLFYRYVEAVFHNMFPAYLSFALLKGPNRYVLSDFYENSEDYGNGSESPENIAEDFIKYLLESMDKEHIDDCNEYINTATKERITVCVVRITPLPMSVYERELTYDEVSTKIEKLSQENKKNVIVIEPITYHLCKRDIEPLRDKYENIYSIEEFLHNFIGLSNDEIENINNDWSSNFEKEVKKKLYQRFEFLRLYEHSERINSINRLIKDLDSCKSSERTTILIIRQSIEEMLRVLHSWYKHTNAPESHTAGMLLHELEIPIKDSFGEDTYNDLNYIIEKANKLIHDPSLVWDEYDKIKMIEKTKLIYKLFKKEVLHDES